MDLHSGHIFCTLCKSSYIAGRNMFNFFNRSSSMDIIQNGVQQIVEAIYLQDLIMVSKKREGFPLFGFLWASVSIQKWRWRDLR